MFHAKDGWYFERLEDGAVQVKKLLGTAADAQYEIVTFDEGTWCSIVATVSVGGENKGRWFSAMDFHAGKTGDRDGFA